MIRALHVWRTLSLKRFRSFIAASKLIKEKPEFDNLTIPASLYAKLTHDLTEVTHTRIIHRAAILKMIVALLFVCPSFDLTAQTTPSREYSIRAAFLYNFTQFVEWPSTAFSNSETPFIIGILGDDPFLSSIDDAVSGEKVNGHPIVVQRYKDVKDIKNCHMLYISAKEALRTKDILSALPNRNVLTVSDIPNFARTGGMIHFINQNDKVGLQINLSAVKAAELNISSKLLRVAELVDKSE